MFAAPWRGRRRCAPQLFGSALDVAVPKDGRQSGKGPCLVFWKPFLFCSDLRQPLDIGADFDEEADGDAPVEDHSGEPATDPSAPVGTPTPSLENYVTCLHMLAGMRIHEVVRYEWIGMLGPSVF